MNSFIGISEDRANHMLSVANQCYNFSKEFGLDERMCRQMFMIGYNHDIGYKFSSMKYKLKHGDIGSDLIQNSTGMNLKCIRFHGLPEVMLDPSEYGLTDFEALQLKILNTSDLTVDSKGNIVSVEERLEDIKSRCGENDVSYKNPKSVAKILGLI